MNRQHLCLILGLIATWIVDTAVTIAEPVDVDPLQAWRDGVVVRPVSGVPDRHTIHTYYLACPESPNGKRVVFYASSTTNGHHGELCVLDRGTGDESMIARNLEVEDAHRAACQQWICNGRRVAFHDVRDGRWGVYAVDVESHEEQLLAIDRQLSFGVPTGNQLPIYGCHWNPGKYRDLELVDADTGDLRTVVTMTEVRQTYGKWLNEQFGDEPVSIFFPILSPDQKRVFFKLACGSGGDEFRSRSASRRLGIVAYDLADRRFLFLQTKWGHPAWHPDSRRILNVGNLYLDTDDHGKLIRIPDLPRPRGSHPSVSPDGRLLVTDGLLDGFDGQPSQWGIFVMDARGGEGRYEILHRFDNSHGAKTWRRNDPHPVFSADGKRIYFNVNETDWTQLYVAECNAASSAVSASSSADLTVP